MEYGFLDEAGDVGAGLRSSRVMVVEVVLTAAPHKLRREVKQFRARLRKKTRQIPELQASQSVPAWNRTRLEGRLTNHQTPSLVMDKSLLSMSPEGRSHIDHIRSEGYWVMGRFHLFTLFA
jgi:hypothetical protein